MGVRKLDGPMAILPLHQELPKPMIGHVEAAVEAIDKSMQRFPKQVQYAVGGTFSHYSVFKLIMTWMHEQQMHF
jgi:hypothetical protein